MLMAGVLVGLTCVTGRPKRGATLSTLDPMRGGETYLTCVRAPRSNPSQHEGIDRLSYLKEVRGKRPSRKGGPRRCVGWSVPTRQHYTPSKSSAKVIPRAWAITSMFFRPT